jgi:hypothetical protein
VSLWITDSVAGKGLEMFGKWRGDREHYQKLAFLAHYYAWEARRGCTTSGNCPLTGAPKERHYPMSDLYREEGRIAHIAKAKFWLKKAKEARERV